MIALLLQIVVGIVFIILALLVLHIVGLVACRIFNIDPKLEGVYAFIIGAVALGITVLVIAIAALCGKIILCSFGVRL